MAEARWDVIIVGQGLAGTTLAWHLAEANRRVLTIDAQEEITSSKIAAGLITPITGQRLALSWNFDDFLSVARRFYRRLEARSGQNFFHDRLALRLFRSQEEQQAWAQRSTQPEFQAHMVMPQPAQLLDPVLGQSHSGGFAMRAAQLDVKKFLSVSRAILPNEPLALNWQQDVVLNENEITVCGYRTNYLISCEGYAATRNPYFSHIPFNAARGDILTVRFDQPLPPNCIHRGIWIAPTSDADIFRVGSTYDWENLDQQARAPARHEIEQRLQEFFHVPYNVLEHQAAVRPIIRESRPHIGLHHEHKRLGIFNGLGSKGALHAPWFAQRFSDFLVNQVPLPESAALTTSL